MVSNCKCAIWVMVLVAFQSCCQNSSRSSVRLFFDNDSPVEVDLNRLDYASIDEVGRIDKVDCSSNGVLLISSNRLFLLDKDCATHKYVSAVGRTNEEYLGLWDAGFINEGIFIYDLNGKKIMFFNLNGDFLRSHRTISSAHGNPFQLFASLNSLNYIGKCSYRGLDGYPELALYDKDFTFVKYVNEEMTLNSGLKMGVPFARTSRNSVLYSRLFYNDIYEVTNDSSFVKYSIDFGHYNYKRTKSKSDYEVVEDLRDYKNKCAVLISDMEEISNDYFAFSFIFPSSRRLGIYNMEDKSCNVISFKCRNNEVLAYIKTFERTLYVFTQTPDGQTRLYRIPFVKDAIHQLKE